MERRPPRSWWAWVGLGSTWASVGLYSVLSTALCLGRRRVEAGAYNSKKLEDWGHDRLPLWAGRQLEPALEGFLHEAVEKFVRVAECGLFLCN